MSPGHALWRGKGRTIDGLSYLIGRVAAKGEGMQGHHIADMGDGIPRTLFVSDESCHDGQTEVLTNTGWRLFKDLTGKETFLTMDPLTRVAGYRLATGVYASKYKGPVYLYERRCGNFCVTPGHKMLWKRQRAGCRVPWSPYYLERIQDLTGTTRAIPRCFVWQGLEEEWFSLPRLDGSRGSWPEKKVPMRTWLEFLGWYVSEGNLGFVNGVPYAINISQADPAVLAHIASLARGMGFRPYIYQDTESPSVRINERRLAEYMLSHGRHAWEKRVPEFVGTLSPDLIRVFLHAFKLGDGYDTHSGRDIYYTSSPHLADELQVLSFKAGREATVNTRSLIGLPAPHGISRRDGFVVGCSRLGLDSHLRIKRKYLQRVDYSGEVYCVTVPPYHTIFTRRNGDCMWGGNSGVDDETYDAADTWARRKLVIGNPLPTTNFFFRGVKGGDLYAKE